MRKHRIIITLIAGVGGCAGSDGSEAEAPSVQIGEVSVRLSAEGVEEFVLSGLYQAWPNKTERRDARQDHKLARTYYNRLLTDAYASGQPIFPAGSLAINEEDLDGDGITDGYSLVVKIADASGPSSWIWYQAPVADLAAPPTFAPGHPDCERCHSRGSDRILANQIPSF